MSTRLPARRLGWLADVAADVRYALRGVRRAPAFAAAALGTLAVGIGATTGVLSVVDAVVLRSLPYRDAGSLAAILERTGKGFGRTPSYPAYQDYLAAVGGPVTGIAYTHGATSTYRTADGLERVVAYRVTPGFFPLLGTSTLLGRSFVAGDSGAGSNSVAVVSYGFWKQRLGGDPAAIGRTIDLDSVPTTMVGVMPEGFDYPEGAQLWLPIDAATSRSAPLQSRDVHVDSRTIVRLRAPRDSAAAAATLGVVASRLAGEYPASSADWSGVEFWPMWKQVTGDIGGTLFTLAGAAALVLLLACANVATLVLIRGSVRSREFAVRASLGASRGRIARQLCAEIAAIAVVGGMGGMLLASGIVVAVRRLMGARLPRSSGLSVDGRLFAIGALMVLVAAIAVGLVPVLRMTRQAIAERLHGWSRDSGVTPRDSIVRNGLVAVQVALAVTLLVGAGLLLQSFRRLYAIPDDYDSRHVDTAGIFPPSPTYDRPGDAAALYERLREAVARVPGVDAAALVNHIGGRLPTRVDLPGRPRDESGRSTAYYVTASSDYQRVMRFRMLRGRWLDEADMRSPEASGFVVNGAMATRFFGLENPLGRIITVHRTSQARPDIGQPISGPIVGVMADVHWYGQENRVEPEVYVPYTREVWPWITVVAHAADPARVAPAIRKAVLSVEPNVPLSRDDGYTGVEVPKPFSFDQRALALTMIGAFALAALSLAAIGLYGVVAYGVTQRTRELGIRMALGATSGSVARLVLGGVIRLVALGVVAGLAGGFATTRLIRAMLFRTAPTDAATYVIVPASLLVVALCAAWAPTRRAMRLDPAMALRAD